MGWPRTVTEFIASVKYPPCRVAVFLRESSTSWSVIPAQEYIALLRVDDMAQAPDGSAGTSMVWWVATRAAGHRKWSPTVPDGVR